MVCRLIWWLFVTSKRSEGKNGLSGLLRVTECLWTHQPSLFPVRDASGEMYLGPAESWTSGLLCYLQPINSQLLLLEGREQSGVKQLLRADSETMTDLLIRVDWNWGPDVIKVVMWLLLFVLGKDKEEPRNKNPENKWNNRHEHQFWSHNQDQDFTVSLYLWLFLICSLLDGKFSLKTGLKVIFFLQFYL